MGDVISDALNKIKMYDNLGKKEVLIKPISNLLKKVLDIFKREKYIEEWEEIEDGRGGILKVRLNGNINKCGSIRPRFYCKVSEIEKYEKRYLPAKGFGLLIISTPKGLLTNVEAKQNNVGGVLIAYVY